MSSSITGGSRPPRLRNLDRDTAGALVAQHDRELDLEEAVLVHGLGLLRAHLGPERDRTLERPVLDLELLVHAALAVLGAAVPRDRQLATLDLEGQLVRIHARPAAPGDPPG